MFVVIHFGDSFFFFQGWTTNQTGSNFPILSMHRGTAKMDRGVLRDVADAIYNPICPDIFQ